MEKGVTPFYDKNGKKGLTPIGGKLKLKLRYYLLLIFIFLFGFLPSSEAADRKEGIENFPQSYQPYLQELQKRFPNWSFTALYTNLDWKYVIDNENQFGKNLVPKSYSDRWKNTKQGEYNVEVDSGWVDCSRRAIEYTMDPRNFLNEVRIFQFEGLGYDAKTNNKTGIEKILYGTEFYNTTVQYLTSSGNTVTMTKKYSDLILSAGQTSKVSSYHLASRIKQEVGPFLSHSSISGNVKGYEGLYNFYNIGATSSSEPMGAIKNGLQYAKDGKGASQATKDKYLIPWNTKEKAITGGGIFIGSSYIHLGQDTIYLQKFHVTGQGELFWHQYMTNVLAPYSESRIVYNGYSGSGILNGSMSFVIPVYENMPEIPVQNPNILESDFTKDNTQVYANVSSGLNIRTGPSTSYEILTTVRQNEKMTRIAKGKQSGELWDQVKLSNGMIGYAFQNYLKEVPKKQIEKINLSLDTNILKKGETKKLNVEILPIEAKDHPVSYTSSNHEIVSVDSAGNLLALKSGKATITVKAQENNVFSKIELEVITPVTGLELTIENLVLQEGDAYMINPIITPEDASNKKVTYEVQNANILQVETSGKITAIQTGTTKVIAKTVDGGFQKEIGVTVVERIGEVEVIFDPSLTVENGKISGFNTSNLSVLDIKNKIQTSYQVKIYHYSGTELTNEQSVGTGSIIRIVDENEIIKMEYSVVIYGDVSGDGKINSTDLLVLQRHILEIEKLKGVFLTAGNISKNGKNPSSLDSLLMQRHILGLQIINQ